VTHVEEPKVSKQHGVLAFYC